MTFLNPSFLFGLIAISIPIVLHFLNLRKLKTVEFSTLTFLKELQKNKIKRIKLKQLLLLLIRILIIIFIVLAFSRPTLKNTFTNSTANTSAVFIIDNTFSMSLINEKGSLLNQAKFIAKNLLNNFQAGDEITIIDIGELKFRNYLPSKSLKDVQNQIEEIEISDVSNTLNLALIEASKILYQSQNLNKEVYVFSDMQRSSLFNNKEELSDYGKIFSEYTRLYLFDLSNDDYNNLGIVTFKPDNQIFQLNKEISFTANVKNYSKEKSNNNVVSLFINGKRSAQKNISLNANESKEVILETTLQDSGLVNFSVELEDDNILADNQFHFSLEIKNKISVLILTDNINDSRFVKNALELNPNVNLDELLLNQIRALNFKKYDLILIIGTTNFENTPDFKNYLDESKNVVIFPSNNTNPINLNTLLKFFNLKYQISEKGKSNSEQVINEFGKVDFNHPLLKNIFVDAKKNKIESPSFYKYLKINLSNNEKQIIRFIDGSPFLFEMNFMKNKFIVFTSAPNLSWNDFPMKSLFVPLLNKIVYYMSMKGKDEYIITGDEININLSNSNSSIIKIVKPNNNNEFINRDSLQTKDKLNYKMTNKKGTYKIYSNEKLIDYFDANINPKESEQEKFTIKEFEDYLNTIKYNGKYFYINQKDDHNKILYESRFGSELWKYFLIIVLILLITESLIARNTKKDLVSINEK
ncbi:MAG: BatA and WFA domain-containing protein [Melioribacteraceae bacterium]|nr:BatA and WFA domain-containing protein [Melioribacteraceae bacterium]